MKENIDEIKEAMINDEIVIPLNESKDEDDLLINEEKSKIYVDSSSHNQKLSIYQLTLEILTDSKKNYKYKLPLNSFIIGLISVILFGISIFVTEYIILLGLFIAKNVFMNGEDIWLLSKEFAKTVFSKWYFIRKLCSHFSIGFFCIKTFSNIFIKTKNPLKFFISNIIKEILFYFLSSLIIAIIVDIIMKESIQKILLENANNDQYPIIKKISDSLIKSSSKKIEKFIGKYNIFWMN